MNLVILTGRPTTDIEVKRTENGTAVASFTLAVDRNFTPKGQEKQADFINCVAWRSTAEFISKWFGKGVKMAVKGELQTRQFVDKNGNNRIAYEVIVDKAEFCESRKNDSQQAEQAHEENTGGFAPLDNGDDLPF